LLEVAVGSGVLGLGVLMWLLLAALRRVRGVPSERTWALASLVAVGLFQLGEPVNVVVTPVLFLLLGLCVMPGRGPQRPRTRTVGAVSIACVSLLSAGLMLSGVAFAGSTFEQWGRRYGELWADRASHAMAPWRVTAAEDLAIRLAVEGRSGDASAGGEALSISRGLVAAHPWDPTVRVSASNVARLLQRPREADAWAAAQFRQFPSDARPERGSGP
jgi:hypothetical protein